MFRLFESSSGTGNALRGRYERCHGAQRHCSVALLTHRQQIPIGDQNSPETAARLRGVRRNQLPALRQSRRGC